MRQIYRKATKNGWTGVVITNTGRWTGDELQGGSVHAERGPAKDHARNHVGLVGPHPPDNGVHLFLQLTIAQLAKVLVNRKAVPAFEDQGYFEGA
jgi:hypothetical protein